MTHAYTQKGARRYRYYVCQKATKRGWGECATRSVLAQEIVDFVLRRNAAIGRDPALASEVAAQARRELAGRREALRRERATSDSTVTLMRPPAARRRSPPGKT
jgi:site-specific DNA recombinase